MPLNTPNNYCGTYSSRSNMCRQWGIDSNPHPKPNGARNNTPAHAVPKRALSKIITLLFFVTSSSEDSTVKYKRCHKHDKGLLERPRQKHRSFVHASARRVSYIVVVFCWWRSARLKHFLQKGGRVKSGGRDEPSVNKRGAHKSPENLRLGAHAHLLVRRIKPAC